MKNKLTFLTGLVCGFGIVGCMWVADSWLMYESKNLCDQVREIRRGERESIRSIIPPKWHERNLIVLAQNLDNRRPRYALNILGGIKSTKGRKIMESLLYSEDPGLRAIAVDSLSYYADEKMYQDILALLSREKDVLVCSMVSTCLLKSESLVSVADLEKLMEETVSSEKKSIIAGVLYRLDASDKRRGVSPMK